MAVCLIVPLGRGGCVSGQYSRVRSPYPGWTGLPAAGSSLFARGRVVAGRVLDTAPVAGRLLVCSEQSPELASSVALRLPVLRWEALLTLPDVVLRLPAETVGIFFFFFCDVTSLLWRVDRALIRGWIQNFPD